MENRPPILKYPHLVNQNQVVTQLVNEMQGKGAIYEVPFQPCLLSRIFGVPKSSGGYRLVIDLVNLNRFIESPPFAMTNHITLRKAIDLPSWMASLDIKDAFHHVSLRPNLHKFVALSCNKKLYFARTLPFGLTSSPMVFTYLMRHPLALLHQQKIRVIAYLDDLLVWGDSPDQVRCSVQTTIQVLTEHGFLLNWPKSAPTPTQTLKWLGIIWNSKTGMISVPPQLAQQIQNTVLKLLNDRRTSRNMFECLLGKITFASQISAKARLLAHSLYRSQILSNREQDTMIVDIPIDLLKALEQWRNPQFLLEPCPIRAPTPSLTVWSDASSKGWGAFTSTDKTFSGQWTPQEARLHINQQELFAVMLTLKRLPRRTSILVMSDNKTTVAAINRLGSNSPEIHRYAIPLFKLVWKRQQHITSLHIPGVKNVIADQLSRDEPVVSENQ